MKRQPKARMPLLLRLMAGIIAFWLVLLTIAMLVTMRYTYQTLQTKIDEGLASTVKTLAESPSVRRMILEGECDPEMADYLTSVSIYTTDLDYITIANADSIRIFHIDPEFIGLPFEGGDQYRALAGECYFSDVSSEHFGEQHRAFHPVRDLDGSVIGFVMASATQTRLARLRNSIYATYWKLFLLLTGCSMIFSAVLAFYLGKNLRGARPEDLLRVYLTQNDILNALDEGLVSFDNAGRVRLVNAAAARMLGHREDLLIGRHVDELLLDENGQSLRDRGSRRLQSNHANILVYTVKLPDSNLWARQVLILADKSEVIRQAEELGGTRHMISALRANTHEFLNKLQVISGLLQMGYVEDAMSYIGNISAVHEQGISPVLKLIRNPNVAALILGKLYNIRELDIELTLMSNSDLPEHSRYLSTDELVTVVGNLLENAIEAINAGPADGLRAVALQLTEDEKGLLIMVSDTGEGISEEDLPHIFRSGFSTKASTGRGVGMKLIKDIADRHGGSIEVDTEPGSGTTFFLIFSRERGAGI